ncbi:MAG: ligase-associated DNA damage response exonuclease [Flavobacteriales bacterium]|nr:ligase-associated DNA damage response exonuclease [Flavobacteriales bacterium]
MSEQLLKFTSSGIYCEKADVFLDPWRAVNRAIISHGHADHARYGHTKYLAHNHTTEIMKHRLGDQDYSSVEYGERTKINGVTFTLIPAGHILGSSQIKVEFNGQVAVFSGDYKLEDDGISGVYEPIPCDLLITECTFGLPIYRWQDQLSVKEEINNWVQDNAEKGISSILFGYSLGKAQRLLRLLETELPIYIHGAVHHMTEIYRKAGVVLPDTSYPLDKKKPKLPCVVICPPSVNGTTWLKKFAPYSTAMASGWMSLRGPRRRRSMDKGFVLSDHMDWKGLEVVMKETAPDRVICTHGYNEIYSEYLRSQGIEAITEKTEFETEEVE